MFWDDKFTSNVLKQLLNFTVRNNMIERFCSHFKNVI